MDPCFESKITGMFRNCATVAITIVSAQPSSDGKYVVYNIEAGDHQVERRYSEFATLQSVLQALHPTTLVPPLPQKQGISASLPFGTNKAGDELVAHRKRMLQAFLQRCERHPILRAERVLHCFFDSSVVWSDLLRSPPCSLLRKNPLQSNPMDPATQENRDIYDKLPIPSAFSAIVMPADADEEQMLESDAVSSELHSTIIGKAGKLNKKLLGRFNEISRDYSELGEAFNLFSLLHAGPEAATIEKVGLACDQSAQTGGELAANIDIVLEEPLFEMAQIADDVQQLLKFRSLKHMQLNMLSDAINNKSALLDQLEGTERESQRISQMLAHSDAQTSANTSAQSVSAGLPGSASIAGSAYSNLPLPEYMTGTQTVRKVAQRNPANRVFGKVSNMFKSMLDGDPEESRKKSITSLKNNISEVSPLSNFKI